MAQMALGCNMQGWCKPKGRAVHCEIDRLAAALSVSDSVSTEARRVCSTVVESGIVKRQRIQLVAASSLYAACREKRVTVTLRELAILSGLKPSEVGRCYRHVMTKMEITPPVPNGTRYVERVATMAGVAEESKRLAQDVERKAVQAGLEDRSPMVAAAAAVYVACLMNGETKTQWQIAEAAGVGVASVREAAKEIRRLPGAAATKGARPW